MTYARTRIFSLGTSNAGLSDLRAQLYDSSGVASGAAISTGFADRGSGLYRWYYAAFPDAFRGWVEVYSNAAPSTVLAIADINPEADETELSSSEISQLRYRLGIDGNSAVPATNRVHLDLASATVTITSPVDTSDGDRLNLIQGDDHTEGDRLPSWTIIGYAGPSMAGGTCILRLLRIDRYQRKDADQSAELEVDATISQSGDTLSITAPITSVQSAALRNTADGETTTHEYQLVGTTSGGLVHTIKLGPVTVTRCITEAD